MSAALPASATASGAAPVHPLLAGPIAATLLRLAVPNMVALSMSVLVAVAETYYVGQLGTVSLAAMALVFPLAMLTQMMSNGAMGSGVSSAISRALGAGDGARASALALHAIVIGAVAGLLYSLIFVLCGATFYGWLGGRGEVLAAATGFGAVLFSGAILVWLCNTLASVVRGTGNMRMPSAVIFAASLVQIVVGGPLGLGLGPMPRWGMPGVAVGNIVAMVLAVAAFLAYLQLEFLLIPMAFGVGMAAVPMVGMAMGAGQVARARRVAWSGGAMAAALLGALGLVVMVWPQLWSGIFTSDPAVRAYADLYLRTVGPAFGLFGLGLVLYFASLGAGRVWAPVLAGTLRLLIVVGGGGWLMSSGLGSAQSLFVLVAVAMAAYGAGTAWAVWRARWG
jgi:Na+-driven multidrug efflux pump